VCVSNLMGVTYASLCLGRYVRAFVGAGVLFHVLSLMSEDIRDESVHTFCLFDQMQIQACARMSNASFNVRTHSKIVSVMQLGCVCVCVCVRLCLYSQSWRVALIIPSQCP